MALGPGSAPRPALAQGGTRDHPTNFQWSPLRAGRAQDRAGIARGRMKARFLALTPGTWSGKATRCTAWLCGAPVLQTVAGPPPGRRVKSGGMPGGGSAMPCCIPPVVRPATSGAAAQETQPAPDGVNLRPARYRARRPRTWLRSRGDSAPANFRRSRGWIMSALSYDVFVSDGVPRVTDLRMPDGSGLVSSPVSSTLIYGDRDAVLADPSWTVAQTEALCDWIERSGKRLASVYATEGTIRKMHEQADSRADYWDKNFPGLIGDTPVLAQPIPDGGFGLEGSQLQAIEVGHTDTDDTTVLHVPSIGLVVAGDVAYNGVHLMLLEIGSTGLKSWLDAIDQVTALHPAAVVADHKNKNLPDEPAILDQTRQYLLDAQRLLGQRPTPREYFDQIIAKYPDRLNQAPVWYSALGLLN